MIPECFLLQAAERTTANWTMTVMVVGCGMWDGDGCGGWMCEKEPSLPPHTPHHTHTRDGFVVTGASSVVSFVDGDAPVAGASVLVNQLLKPLERSARPAVAVSGCCHNCVCIWGGVCVRDVWVDMLVCTWCVIVCWECVGPAGWYCMTANTPW